MKKTARALVGVMILASICMQTACKNTTGAAGKDSLDNGKKIEQESTSNETPTVYEFEKNGIKATVKWMEIGNPQKWRLEAVEWKDNKISYEYDNDEIWWQMTGKTVNGQHIDYEYGTPEGAMDITLLSEKTEEDSIEYIYSYDTLENVAGVYQTLDGFLFNGERYDCRFEEPCTYIEHDGKVVLCFEWKKNESVKIIEDTGELDINTIGILMGECGLHHYDRLTGLCTLNDGGSITLPDGYALIGDDPDNVADGLMDYLDKYINTQN